MTVIANFIATTLPNQMTANDVNHSLQVENQLGHLRALLQATSTPAALGAQIVQPVSLGSEGLPPFAAPDGGNITAVPHQPNASAVVSLLSTHYAPPTGWAPNEYPPAGCTANTPTYPTQIDCHGAGTYNQTVQFNFSGTQRDINFSLTGTGGASFLINFTTNYSSDNIVATGGAFNQVNLVGDNNTGTIETKGGGNTNLTIVGDGNNITLEGLGTSSVLRLLVVGNHDWVNLSSVGQGTAYAVVWGSYDYVDAVKGGSMYTVTFYTFDADLARSAQLASPLCPYDLPLTDYVVKQKGSGPSGTLTYYNTQMSGTYTTNPLSPNAPYRTWTTHYIIPTPFACIFFPQFRAEGSNVVAASFAVHLLNSYAPRAEVAFDQGAVISAQPGGYPVMVDPPPVSFSSGIANVWLPAFLGPVGSESGTGTAVMNLRLYSAEVFAFPGGGWLANPGHNFGNATDPVLGSIQLNYTTPYAYAWNHSAWASSIRAAGGTVHCGSISGASDPALCGPTPSAYEPGGPLGLVTITLPAVRLVLTMAVFTIALQ